MKRLLTILMVLMLLFVNVGCGEKGRLQEDNDTNIQQETKDKEKNLYDPADDIKPIAVGTVTISISCVTLLNHLDVYEGDANAIPKGGEILPAVSVELYENDTAYTLLKRVCREKNIEVDGEWDADKIMENKSWTMADIFADEGITGTSAKKRADFMRMMKWCKQGKIDLILTKSVSRFARNGGLPELRPNAEGAGHRGLL